MSIAKKEQEVNPLQPLKPKRNKNITSVRSYPIQYQLVREVAFWKYSDIFRK